MKFRYLLQVGCLAIMGMGVAFGQESMQYTHSGKQFQKALSLYNRKQYKAAQHFFQQEMQQTTDVATRANCSYFVASSAIRLGQSGADALMEQFLADYPSSPYAGNAGLDVADYYFTKGNYKQAETWYDKVDASLVTPSERDKYNFQKGYALFSQGKKDQAKKYFTSVKNSKEYGQKAAYYLGYMAYDADDYDQASQYFEQVQDDEVLSKNLSYYQADMNFKQGNFQKALTEGLTQLKKNTNPKEKSELNKIVGESYFNLKQYAEAIPYLKAYQGKQGKYTNTDYYYLGYAYYKQNDYQNAIGQFNKIIDGKNAVAQNAYYHLAECYLKTNQKQQALNAFRNASQMDFSAEIKKDAMLNYTRLSYDIGNPYESVPSVIQSYMQTYPDSNATEMKDLLVDSYVTSGDYKSAMELLEKSSTTTDKKVYQQVAFYRGLELYNDMQYAEALAYFQKAQAPHDTTINARATYWSAEVNYLLHQYAEAENNYKKFLTLNQTSLAEYKEANYGLGYAYFNQKKYELAISAFEKYLATNSTNKNRVADAYIRTADSHFVLGKYWPAMEAYNKVITTKATDTDYASFQKAISYGFVDRVPKKIEELDKFVRNYPKSALREDALFELGNTHLAQGNTQKAIQMYRQLQTEYKTSSFVPRAMLREALIYYNQGDNPKALNIFKEITAKYPNTSEALQAVNTAKSVYVDMGKVNEYAQWAKGLGYVEVSNSELDNASFEAAERHYLQQKNKEAIAGLEKYLKDFPQGLNTTQAQFYLGQLYFSEGNKAKATPYYEKVVSAGRNEYTEQALTRLSQIYLDNKDTKKAEPVLKELEETATIAQNVVYAQSNLMKISYENKAYPQTIQYAQKVLTASNVDNRIKNDANTMIARAYIATGDEVNAEKYYTEVRKTASGALMAEALYYDAYFKNKDGQYKKSNEIIQKLAKEYGGYKEFSAKGLVLMAKNFNGLKDNYQATYILNSVIDNFGDYPDVIKEAKETLDKIKSEGV